MNYIIAGTFLLGMILIGILSMKRIRGASSYFVADREANTPAVTGSLLATIIGGSSTIGIAGLGYSKGLVGAWWMLVGAIGLLLLSVWFAERVRNYEAYTLPEILRKQYGGNTVRIIASVLIAAAWLGIIAAQIIAAGKILSVLWPGQSVLLMIIAGSVFIIYTLLGGQYSILRTDLIQSAFIIAGVIVCAIAGVSAAGGLSGMTENLSPSYFSFPTSPDFGWVDLLTFLFFVGSTYLVGPDIYSRIFCSKDPKVARRSLVLAAAVMIPTAFLITFAGIAARVLLPEIQPESALPALVMSTIPTGLNGLVIIALLAAVMSSADTCLLTTSTIIASDILSPLFKIDEKNLLGISRICVIVTGIVSLVIALRMQGIIASLLLAYTIYSAGLVIPILFGFHAERFGLNAAGAMIAIAGGGVSGLFMKLSGHSALLLCTIPLSAMLLFAGSYTWNRAHKIG
ncbi:MAG: sodium:solute symporter family protein [Deltaproteobacteria bacterium]|nr:sodium:solute symporter family protein [Deltaproteobacteria bacterium]MBW2648331.1 sodium:solute symporter family protein [Deltaproteobacteria bacterium]